MDTKPNLSTGIKGIYYNAKRGTYRVSRDDKGFRIDFGTRKDFNEAMKLHAKAYPSEESK